MTLEEQAINVIRGLSMDGPQAANSGHPGTAMALAPLAHVLWTAEAPDWPDHDRFVLSAGHASILLYSMLYLTGFGLELEDLRQFRQFGSRTPGHPERNHTPGVEVTTGPLGQGVANGVGMGVAEERRQVDAEEHADQYDDQKADAAESGRADHPAAASAAVLDVRALPSAAPLHRGSP